MEKKQKLTARIFPNASTTLQGKLPDVIQSEERQQFLLSP
jgi:hypothetical protein